MCVLAVALALAGCVTRTHEENAARRATFPLGAVQPTFVATGADAGWPTVKGDILRGTSPAELAKARAAVSQTLTEALARP
jgi:hypothetical protein